MHTNCRIGFCRGEFLWPPSRASVLGTLVLNHDNVAGVALGSEVDETIYPVLHTLQQGLSLVLHTHIGRAILLTVVPHHSGARRRPDFVPQVWKVGCSASPLLHAVQVNEY